MCHALLLHTTRLRLRCLQTRFLLPVLPMCTVVAACGLHQLWSTHAKSAVYAAARLASIGALILSAAAVAVFTQASIHNYPGEPHHTRACPT